MTNTQVSNVWDEFARGMFAFYISGPWNIGEFRRRLPPSAQGSWATAPLPGPNGLGVSTAGGSSLANAASVLIYLRSASDFAAMNEVYATYFPTNPPARTTVAVTQPLANADGLVEISMVAIPDGGERTVIHPDGWAKVPSPYSYGIKSGNTLFLAGLVSRNGKDNANVPGDITAQTRKRMWQFSLFLCCSIIPSLFLSLLWHSFNVYIRTLATIGSGLITVTLSFFLAFIFNRSLYRSFQPASRNLLYLAIASFAIKMILQIGTIVPALGNAVFGFRPIIIGFLHLVFLGLITFYVLSHLLQAELFSWEKRIARFAIRFFSAAIIINETILLIDGIGLLFYTTNRIYPWLLWIASILLFVGSLLVLAARLSSLGNKKVIVFGR